MTTPKANVLRTVLQALVAVLVAVPAAIALVPIPDKYAGSVALVVGIAAGAVVLITAVQNAIESSTGVALFRTTTATGIPPVAGDSSTPAANPANADAPPRGPP